MKTQGRLLSWSAGILSVCALVATASAVTIAYDDGTYDLTDYTVLKFQSPQQGVTLTVSQLASGGNPGTALSTVADDTANVQFAAKIGLINNSWNYDPGTEGAITNIFFSEDKYSNLEGTPFTSSSIRMLIKQNGKTYVAGTSVTATPDAWIHGSATFVATDFVRWDFNTGDIIPAEHPDFTIGPMQFGIASSPSQSGSGGSPTTYTFNFDNTHIALNVPVPEEVLQGVKILGVGYTGGAGITKYAINVKTLAQSLTPLNINQGAKPDHVLLLVSTVLASDATKRLLVFRKIVGGNAGNDVELLDLSNIDDYGDPHSRPIAFALDPFGLGYEIDNVVPMSASLFSGFGGQSLTTISKGAPHKRVYEVHMSGTIGGVPAVLNFKITAGKGYEP